MRFAQIVHILFVVLLSMPLTASVKFKAKTSKVSASGNSKIKATNQLTITNGTLSQGKNATLEGVNYAFVGGTYTKEQGSNITSSGTLNPTAGTFSFQDTAIQLGGGSVGEQLQVSGKSSLEGFASDSASNQNIQLQDSATTLNLAVTSPLSSNIVLNNGSVTAQGNVTLSKSSSLEGNGVVNFNGHTVQIVGAQRRVSGRVVLRGARDLQFTTKIILDGQWTFTEDAVVSGNGNILDLSLGGSLRIMANTGLALTNLKLRGLGLGKIIFDDYTSTLTLSSVEIEMNRNYTVTIGGIYAEGPTRIVTKDYKLTFDTAGSLTVDGIALEYDTLGYQDSSNIMPLAANDPQSAHITLLNDGVIRSAETALSRANSNALLYLTTNNSNALLAGDATLLDLIYALAPPPIADIHFIGDGQLETFLSIQPQQRIFFDESATLDGQTNVLYISNALQPLIFVDSNKTAHLTNIVLQNVSPDFIKLWDGASLLFDDATKIDFAKNEELNTTWTCNGAVVINGHNHILNLGEIGNIVIKEPGSSLLIENVILTGVSGNKIRCFDNSSTVSFKNVIWHQDATYGFTTGRFDMLGTVELAGVGTFVYQSNRQSKIAAGATLILEHGLTFSYDPISNNRDLLALEDATAFLFLNGASLASTTTGLRLTKGHVLIDHQNFLVNDGAVSASQGICFGNGNADDDLAIDLLPGGNLKLLSGQFVYANVD